MLVEEIMTKNVISVDANNTVFDALLKYKDKKVGCLIVTDKEQCVGIVTERDIIERAICLCKNPEKTRISEIMSSDVKTIQPLETVEDAAEMMKEYRVKKLPVVFEDNIIGIITISDIAYAKPELTKRFIESWIKPRWED